MTEPTIRAKARVLRTHPSERRANVRSPSKKNVSIILNEESINSPTTIALTSAIKTDLVTSASKTAKTGGRRPKRPYSI